MAIQLTKQQKQYLGAGAFLGVVFCSLYFYFFWLPIAHKMSDLAAELAQMDAKIAQAKAQAARLPRLQEDLVALRKQSVEIDKRLPKTKSVPDVLNALTRLGGIYHVTLQTFTPGPQKGQQYFTEWSYPMVVKGNYHHVGHFFAALALEERILNVKDVNYSGGADGEMSVAFTLLAYQYKQ